MLARSLLAFGIATLAPAALAETVYTCKVVAMVTAPDVGHDPQFEADNKRKIFTITDRGSTLGVNVKSDTLKESDTEFPVQSRDDLRGIIASLENPIGLETVMLSEMPIDGVYEATVVNQYVLFVNSWHLECTRAGSAAAPAQPVRPRSTGKNG